MAKLMQNKNASRIKIIYVGKEACTIGATSKKPRSLPGCLSRWWQKEAGRFQPPGNQEKNKKKEQ